MKTGDVVVSDSGQFAFITGEADDSGFHAVQIDVIDSKKYSLSRYVTFILDRHQQKEFKVTSVIKPKASWYNAVSGKFSFSDVVGFVGAKWRTIKQVAYSLVPGNEGLADILRPFVGKDELRPVMSLLYFDDAGVTATDAMKLIHLSGKVDKEHRGTYDLMGRKKDEGRYPTYTAVVPKEPSVIEKVDVPLLYNYVRMIVDSNMLNKTTNQIRFRYGTKTKPDDVIALNASFLLIGLEAMMKIGGQTWYAGLTQSNRAVVWMNKPHKDVDPEKDTYVLLMPVMIMNDDADGDPSYQHDSDWKRSVLTTYDFRSGEVIDNGKPIDLRTVLGGPQQKDVSRPATGSKPNAPAPDRLRMAQAKAKAAAARIRILKLK